MTRTFVAIDFELASRRVPRPRAKVERVPGILQSVHDRPRIARTADAEERHVQSVHDVACRDGQARRLALQEPRRLRRNRVQAPEPVGLLVPENLRASVDAQMNAVILGHAFPNSLRAAEPALIVHQGARVRGELLPLQERREVTLGPTLGGNSLREMVPEQQHGEVAHRAADGGEVPDDVPPEPRPDCLYTERIARALDRGARVELREKRRGEHRAPEHSEPTPRPEWVLLPKSGRRLLSDLGVLVRLE
ncbi:MAG: hypothetical protein IT379_26665 [Deltaproteobacteria bacterium]|nr:hypothetical protein [Deltaproteobacteria bacterium]